MLAGLLHLGRKNLAPLYGHLVWLGCIRLCVLLQKKQVCAHTFNQELIFCHIEVHVVKSIVSGHLHDLACYLFDISKPADAGEQAGVSRSLTDLELSDIALQHSLSVLQRSLGMSCRM